MGYAWGTAELKESRSEEEEDSRRFPSPPRPGKGRNRQICVGEGGGTAEVLFLKEAIKYNLVSLMITLYRCAYPLGAARGPADVPGPHLRAVPGGGQDALASPSTPAHPPGSPVPTGLITTSGALGEKNSS